MSDSDNNPAIVAPPPVGEPAWTTPPIDGSPPPRTVEDPGYDPGDRHRRGVSERPWWGFGDVLLSIPLVGAAVVGATIVAFVIAAAQGHDIDELQGADVVDLPPVLLVVPTIVQQLTMFVWPFVVSRWKGLGPVRDWGWAFKPVDIGIGIGTALIGLFTAGFVAAGLAALVDLEDDAAASNTQILNDLEGSPWLFGLLFIVIIGAPFSEEIFFRGLVMRSVQKRWGAVAGIAASVLFFIPLHIADGGVFSAGQVVLWGSIAALGIVLGLAAYYSNRLAGPILAHVIINAVGTVGALGWFDDLTAAASPIL